MKKLTRLQLALEAGYNKGRLELLEKNDKLERENKKLREELENKRAKALSDICQAGSTVVESMAKALLSFDHNL